MQMNDSGVIGSFCGATLLVNLATTRAYTILLIGRGQVADSAGWAWWTDSHCRSFASTVPGDEPGTATGAALAWEILRLLHLTEERRSQQADNLRQYVRRPEEAALRASQQISFC